MIRPGWIPRTCSECRKSFMGSKRSQQQCSRLCRDRSKITSRRRILDRDSFTCGYCDVLSKRHAKPLRPNFLRIVRVNPQRKPTADNLCTICRRCAQVWEGVRLSRDKEAHILAQNRKFNRAMDMDDSEVLAQAES